MWGLVALIVIGVGLVWYAGLQPQIPSELSFLKWDHHATAAAAVDSSSAASSSSAPLAAVTGTAGWRVFSTADGFEYSKDFEGSIRGGTEQYDAPIFGITCYHNAAYVRIDTRLRAVGTKAVRVTFNGDAADWVRAEGQNIFAPNSARLLNSLSGLPRAQAQLSFAEAPPQTFTLNLNGIDKILDALHRTCALPR